MPTDDSNSTHRACPDCGQDNPAGAEACARCNFPLTDGPSPPAAAKTPDPAPAAVTPPAPPRRLIEEREKRKVKDPSLTLWLVIGLLGAISLLFVAVQGFRDSNFPAVEGAAPEQQMRADEVRAAIEADSTNVTARIVLGDVLYDTGNWTDAIVEYRAALRMDSTRIEALVDLGVCYYNLGFTDLAANHFLLALAKNPLQTVALFNMGILSERRDDPEAALQYYHRALQTEPPERMRPPIVEALTRVQTATGRTAPPLPEGR
jgi:tetratricopeptide (TPR) repeat protein